MKKIYHNMMLMTIIAIASLAFTSCEDARIARTLGAYSSGSGYWVDYYSDAPWDYIANHIDWTVDYGTIKIRFVEEDTWIRISDYHLDDDRFYGVLDDNGRRVDFELYHTSSPNWNGYRWGYDAWYGYYAPARRSAASDSTATEKPVRFVRSSPIPQLRKSPSASYARQMPRPPLNDTSTAFD